MLFAFGINDRISHAGLEFMLADMSLTSRPPTVSTVGGRQNLRKLSVDVIFTLKGYALT